MKGWKENEKTEMKERDSERLTVHRCRRQRTKLTDSCCSRHPRSPPRAHLHHQVLQLAESNKRDGDVSEEEATPADEPLNPPRICLIPFP